ncbi:DNA topoisomerase IV [uncultured Flavobacterium sp.]|uniref:DNA topoisomerase IV n=1 Tax=uncultured Flavobacterium sp. TaxID=165435 RepID=UPI0030CA254A
MPKHISYFVLSITLLFASCYNQERKCSDFKTGKFKSEIMIDEKKFTTTFERNDSVQIETFEGITDSYIVRWTNDCEYVIKNSQPKNKAERKAVQVKILTTLKNAYTFEYNYVGEKNKQKGTVYKLED